MKLRKLNGYKIPGYPTKNDFQLDPDIIKKYLPAKWSRNKLLIFVAAAFTLINKVEAGKKSEDIHISVDRDQDNSSKDADVRENAEVSKRAHLVAPLFIHGDGTGATGCVVINPPTFLSEAEARQIIEEELMNENIFFDKKNYKMDDAVFKRKKYYTKIERDTVNLDAYSSKYNLGYEFISADDYFKFGGESDMSTVTYYDVVKAAENLREKMKEDGKINCVIFYDPMERNYDEKENRKGYGEWLQYKHYNYDEMSEEERTARYRTRKSKSVELLKKQVSDFIEWAKKEDLLSSN